MFIAWFKICMFSGLTLKENNQVQGKAGFLSNINIDRLIDFRTLPSIISV